MAEWETVSEWQPVSEWEDISQIEGQVDSDVVENLPDTLKFAIWDTGIKLDKLKYGSPAMFAASKLGMDTTEEIGAAMVGAGHMMTDIYRGVKQILGIDEEKMKADQEYMDKLYADKDVGGYAIGGAVVGALAEPAGFLVPGGKAKSLASAGKIATKQVIKEVGKASARGAAVGITYGGLSYVNQAKGQTRIGNAAIGGTIGGALSGTIRGVGVRNYNKSVVKANDKIDNVEFQWAKKLLEDKPTETIRKELIQEIPNLKLKEAQSLTGRRPSLVSTKDEALNIVNFYNNARPKQSELSIGLDKITGVMSTRISNISKTSGDRLRKYDSNVSIKTHNLLNDANIWLQDINGLSSKAKKDVSKALFSEDFTKAKAIMKAEGGDKLAKEFDKVEKILNDLGDQLEEAGRITKRDNYFPRFVNDKEGLFNAIGQKERSRMEQALEKARKAVINRGYPLSPAEETDVINKALRGYPKETFKPRFTKQRGIENIDDDLLKFYSSPEEALHSYIRDAVTDLEKVKFFGKDIKYKDVDGIKFFDIDASIGESVRKELLQGKLSHSQQRELEHLLSIRFGIGERSPAGLVQDGKNLMYAGLLGNPVAAATQLGDLAISVYTNGFTRTLKSIAKSLTGKAEISAKDLGLVDAMAETFATTRKSSKFMRGAMKLGLFQQIDRFGKNTIIESSLSKYRKLSKTTKGIEKIRTKYGRVYGEDFNNFVRDLKDGRISENVKHFLYSEVADVQPVSLSEVPEMYLRLPNGRIMYMMKTFMLKQLDIVRRDSYNQIKAGHVAKGLGNLMKYGIILGSANTGSRYVKEWMQGRDVEADLPADIGENFLKMFAYNEYLEEKLKEGKVFEVGTSIVTPPWQMFDDILESAINNATEDEPDYLWTQYMPVWGRLWYQLYGGGLEKYEEKLEREEMRELDEQ